MYRASNWTGTYNTVAAAAKQLQTRHDNRSLLIQLYEVDMTSTSSSSSKRCFGQTKKIQSCRHFFKKNIDQLLKNYILEQIICFNWCSSSHSNGNPICILHLQLFITYSNSNCIIASKKKIWTWKNRASENVGQSEDMHFYSFSKGF